MNSRHPDPRRVLGRCRAAVRGQDPLDPGNPRDPLDPRMGSFFRVSGMKNDENENTGIQAENTGIQAEVLEMKPINSFLCTKGSARLRLGGVLGGPGRALGGSIYTQTPDQPHQRPLC